tara:strand:+ start:3883 stop:4299 length:417 start_codon:yes stop_codon:yes gene_type:complete
MNYKIIAKYIKNLQFKIPSTKTFFSLAQDISKYKINIDIKSNQVKEKIIEVETKLSLISSEKNSEKITTEISHSTIVEITKAIQNKEDLEKIILIEVPNKIYSEVRNSFIFLFESSGYKDIKIDREVNFLELYEKNKN